MTRKYHRIYFKVAAPSNLQQIHTFELPEGAESRRMWKVSRRAYFQGPYDFVVRHYNTLLMPVYLSQPRDICHLSTSTPIEWILKINQPRKQRGIWFSTADMDFCRLHSGDILPRSTKKRHRRRVQLVVARTQAFGETVRILVYLLRKREDYYGGDKIGLLLFLVRWYLYHFLMRTWSLDLHLNFPRRSIPSHHEKNNCADKHAHNSYSVNRTCETLYLFSFFVFFFQQDLPISHLLKIFSKSSQNILSIALSAFPESLSKGPGISNTNYRILSSTGNRKSDFVAHRERN